MADDFGSQIVQSILGGVQEADAVPEGVSVPEGMDPQVFADKLKANDRFRVTRPEGISGRAPLKQEDFNQNPYSQAAGSRGTDLSDLFTANFRAGAKTSFSPQDLTRDDPETRAQIASEQTALGQAIQLPGQIVGNVADKMHALAARGVDMLTGGQSADQTITGNRNLAAATQSQAFVPRTVRGVGESVLQAALAARLGGQKAVIGSFGVTKANEAFTDAKNAGYSAPAATAYAGLQGTIESGLTAAFGKMLGGGFEANMARSLGGEAAPAVHATLRSVFRQYAADALKELPEEAAIEIADNAAQQWWKTNGQQWGKWTLADAARSGGDILAQTILASGVGSAAPAYADVQTMHQIQAEAKLRGVDPQVVADEINEQLQQAREARQATPTSPTGPAQQPAAPSEAPAEEEVQSPELAADSPLKPLADALRNNGRGVEQRAQTAAAVRAALAEGQIPDHIRQAAENFVGNPTRKARTDLIAAINAPAPQQTETESQASSTEAGEAAAPPAQGPAPTPAAEPSPLGNQDELLGDAKAIVDVNPQIGPGHLANKLGVSFERGVNLWHAATGTPMPGSAANPEAQSAPSQPISIPPHMKAVTTRSETSGPLAAMVRNRLPNPTPGVPAAPVQTSPEVNEPGITFTNEASASSQDTSPDVPAEATANSQGTEYVNDAGQPGVTSESPQQQSQLAAPPAISVPAESVVNEPSGPPAVKTASGNTHEVGPMTAREFARQYGEARQDKDASLKELQIIGAFARTAVATAQAQGKPLTLDQVYGIMWNGVQRQGRYGEPGVEASMFQAKRLYDTGGKFNISGLASFGADGKALVTFFETANKSTGVHETAHVFRKWLGEFFPNLLKDAEAALGVDNTKYGWSESSLRAVGSSLEQKVQSLDIRFRGGDLPSMKEAIANSSLTQEEQSQLLAEYKSGKAKIYAYPVHEEAFARGFEKYLATEKAPTPLLQKVFETFKQWLIDVYRAIKGSPLEENLPSQLKKVFDAMLRGDPVPLRPRQVIRYEMGIKRPDADELAETAAVAARDKEKGKVGAPPKEVDMSRKDVKDFWAEAYQKVRGLLIRIGMDDGGLDPSEAHLFADETLQNKIAKNVEAFEAKHAATNAKRAEDGEPPQSRDKGLANWAGVVARKALVDWNRIKNSQSRGGAEKSHAELVVKAKVKAKESVTPAQLEALLRENDVEEEEINQAQIADIFGDAASLPRKQVLEGLAFTLGKKSATLSLDAPDDEGRSHSDKIPRRQRVQSSAVSEKAIAHARKSLTEKGQLSEDENRMLDAFFGGFTPRDENGDPIPEADVTRTTEDIAGYLSMDPDQVRMGLNRAMAKVRAEVVLLESNGELELYQLNQLPPDQKAEAQVEKYLLPENADIRARVVSNRPAKTESPWQQLKDYLGSWWGYAVRAQQHVPQTAENAAFNDIMRRSKDSISVNADKAERAIGKILNLLDTTDQADSQVPAIAPESVMKEVRQMYRGVTPSNKRLMFELKILYDDIHEGNTREGDDKLSLRFGFTPAEFAKEKSKIDKMVEQTPAVQKAVDLHRALWASVAEEQVQRGMLPAEVLDNAGKYFHRRVREFQAALSRGISDPKLKPRGYQHGRSTRDLNEEKFDYSTNYAEASIIALTDAMANIAKQDALRTIRKLYEAKESPENKDTHRWVTITAGHPWFTEGTITDKVVKEFLQKAGQPFADPHIHNAITFLQSLNPPSKIYLPNALATQLESMKSEPGNDPVSRGVRWLVRDLQGEWKRFQTAGPFRVLPFSLGNAIGDIDAFIGITAFAPAAWKGVPSAFARLVKYHGIDSGVVDLIAKISPKLGRSLRASGVGQKQFDLDGTIELARDHSVLNASSTTADFPGQEEIRLLHRLAADPSLLAKAADVYYVPVQKLLNVMESTLRLAAFEHYLRQMEKGKITHYGASSKSEIDMIRSQLGDVAAAAKMTRDGIGDYGNQAPLVNNLKAIEPFAAWAFLNPPRYFRMMVNSALWGVRAAEGKSLADKVLSTAIRTPAGAGAMGAIYLLTMLYNRLLHPDEEDELSDRERSSAHLIAPWRLPDGAIIVKRNVGAFGDMLEWAGVNTFIARSDELANNQMTVGEVAAEAARDVSNKFFGGLGPIVKVPLEMWSGKSTYPDFWNPRPANRRDILAGAVGLQDEVRAIQGAIYGDGTHMRPHYMARRLAGVADPDRNASYAIAELRDRFLEKLDVPRYPRNEHFYNMREAADAGRWDIFEQARRQYLLNGGNYRKFLDGMARINPIVGVPEKDRERFINEYLTPDQREKLDRASRYANDIRIQMLHGWNHAAANDSPEVAAEVRKQQVDHAFSQVRTILQQKPVKLTPKEKADGLTIQKKIEDWKADRAAAKEELKLSGLMPDELQAEVLSRFKGEMTDRAAIGKKMGQLRREMGWGQPGKRVRSIQPPTDFQAGQTHVRDINRTIKGQIATLEASRPLPDASGHKEWVERRQKLENASYGLQQALALRGATRRSGQYHRAEGHADTQESIEAVGNTAVRFAMGTGESPFAPGHQMPETVRKIVDKQLTAIRNDAHDNADEFKSQAARFLLFRSGRTA